MAHITDPVNSKRRRDVVTVVFAVLVSLFLAAGMGSVALVWQRLERAERNQAALAAQVKELGGTPVVAPPPVKGISTDDVRVIVTDELAKHKASLTQAEISQIARVAAGMVPKPKDGATPTPAQVRAVVASTVAAYCVSDKCVGKTGGEGPKGDPGVRGQDAPKVTDEELLASAKAALAAYCGQDSQPCRGPAGEPGATVTGPPGPAGEQGRGVADMDCMEDGRWRVTYDKPFPDGETVRYSSGPCRVVVVPTR